jgi:hypothetical protein
MSARASALNGFRHKSQRVEWSSDSIALNGPVKVAQSPRWHIDYASAIGQ